MRALRQHADADSDGSRLILGRHVEHSEVTFIMLCHFQVTDAPQVHEQRPNTRFSCLSPPVKRLSMSMTHKAKYT